MSRPLCLIVNPAAARGRAVTMLPALTAALVAAGAEHRVVVSSSEAHAKELATDAARSGEVVVAVGGDGTAGGLAGVAAATGTPFGLIPAGRGNDLARTLRIPTEPAQAARVLTAGRLREIDLIAASTPGRPEVVAAASVYAGIPAVAGQIANGIRWPTGPMVYSLAALRALASWRPARFTVEMAGNQIRAGSPLAFDGYAIVIANSPFFGAGMRVAPAAAVDDGVLDVVLMRHAPKVVFIRVLLRIKDGTHVALPQISLERGADITITMNRDLPAAADGDALPFAMPLAAGTPLRVRALPGALRVFGPAGRH